MRRFGSLRRRADFARVFRSGKAAGTKHLALHAWVDRRPPTAALVGISIPKAVGGAVERNRLRRRAKAVFDGLPLDDSPGLRLVLVAKAGAAALGYAQWKDEITLALRRLQLA